MDLLWPWQPGLDTRLDGSNPSRSASGIQLVRALDGEGSFGGLSWHPDLSRPPSPREAPQSLLSLLSPEGDLASNLGFFDSEREALSNSSLPPPLARPIVDTRAAEVPGACETDPPIAASVVNDTGVATNSTSQTVGEAASKSQVVQNFAGAHNFAIGTVVSGDYHVHYSQSSAVGQLAIGPSKAEVLTIANWLSSVNYWKYHDMAVACRTPNTGSWFLGSEKFTAWVEDEGSPMRLWAIGMPGAGKSILSSKVVDHLRERYSTDKHTVVLFAYCRYKDSCTVGDVLRSFLKQLLEMRYTAYSALKPVHDAHHFRQTQLPDAEAEAVLHRILLLFQRRYTVIDGIDEVSVDVKSKILALLQRLPTKVLLFSRPVEASRFSAQIVVTAQTQDLGTFVSDTIAKNTRLSQLCTPDIADQIRQNVVEKSKGMFLVAALQIEALKRCVNTSTLQMTLENLPSGVHDMYRNTWRRIEDQTEAESDLAKRTLLWLARSKRPLTVDELQEALATSVETGKNDKLSVTPLGVILNVCCGLVVENPVNKEISLIHYTTHEYLLQLQSAPFSNHAIIITGTCITTLVLHGFTEQELHDLRALAVFLSRSAFLPYAFRYWLNHASEVGVGGGSWHTKLALLQAMKPFENSLRLPCLVCNAEYEGPLFRRRSQDIPSQGASPCLDLHTAFQIATCSGLTQLIQLFPFDDSPTPVSGSISLHLALKHGHSVMAKFLIEAFPTLDINAQNFSGQSGLHLAIRRADRGTVRLLLNHPNTNVNCRDKSEATPIWEAVCVGDKTILASLLRHPLLNVNAGHGKLPPTAEGGDLAIQLTRTDEYAGMTPLIFAVICNKEDVAAMLLHHPRIDPNLCGPHGLSPLLAAIGSPKDFPGELIEKQLALGHYPSLLLVRSVRGSKSMAELVLSHPSTDVNRRVGLEGGPTPLMLASMSGRPDIVDVLLSHRNVDVNATAEQFQTAFSWVGEAFRGLLYSEQALVHGGTKLLLKQYNHGMQTVQSILSHPRLDPDLICDGEGTTPLMVASMLGLDSTVKLLLSSPKREGKPSYRIAIAPISSLLSGISSLFRTAVVSENSHGTASASLPSVDKRSPSRSSAQGVPGPYSRVDENSSSAGYVTSMVERINQVDSQKRSPLLLALSPLSHNIPTTVNTLLSQPSIDVNQRDVDGNTALIIACKRNLLPVVQLLLSRLDIEVNACNRQGNSALLAAVARRLGDSTDMAAVDALLSQPSIKVNQQDVDGNTALIIASKRNLLPTVQLLLSRNDVEANVCNKQGRNALMAAVACQSPGPLNGPTDLATITALLSQPSINVNQQDVDGNTALIIACERNLLSTVQLILSRDDIEIDVCNRQGSSALTAAAASPTLDDSTDVLRLLLLNPGLQNLNRKNLKQQSALHLAIESATRPPYNTAASILLSSFTSMDVNSRNGAGDTPLHLASYHGLQDLSAALLRRPDIDVGLPDPQGSSAIHIACERRHVGVAQNLLRHRAIDLEATNRSGNMPLHIAVEHSDEEILTLLLRHPSVDVNSMNGHGYAAIHIAARLVGENTAVLCTLLKQPRIDVNLRDREGFGAVDILCRFPNTGALEVLLQHPGLEPNALHHHRSFYSACWRRAYSATSPKSRQTKIDMRIIQHFLRDDPGCVRFADQDGMTVLHHAAKQGCVDLVALIVRRARGAWPEVDTTSHDAFGKSALDYALEAGHDLCAQELSPESAPFGNMFEVATP